MIQSIIDELALAQSTISDEDVVIQVINGLNPDFGSISTVIQVREMRISCKELFHKLIDFENVLKQQHEANSFSPLSSNYV